MDLTLKQIKEQSCNQEIENKTKQKAVEDTEISKALLKAQQAFAGVADELGVQNEEDVQSLVDELR